MTAPETAYALAEALAEVLGTRPVTGLRRLSTGASRETWAFDANGRALILRRDPPDLPRPVEMAREAECFRAAAATGAPVPTLLATGDGSDPIGAPYLMMERLDGETLPTRLLRDDRWATVRPRLPRELGRVLARIHSVEPAAVPSLAYVPDRLAALRQRHDAFGEPRPALETAFRWLEANRPPQATPTLVHGDFRNGNLLITPAGLRAVLDWELAHIGDPREDLGWVCTRAWRFGARPAVGGFGDREELFAGYAEVTGHNPNPAAVHWWEVFGCVHWAVICRIQAERHLTGGERSLELAVLGRRAVEAEYDALLALGIIQPGETAEQLPIPQIHVGAERPTVDELLDALAGFLTDELTTEDPRTRYLARVARTAVSVIRRDLQTGPPHPQAHSQRLAALGSTDNATLATAIRAGTLNPDDPDVASVIRSHTLARLAIANPHYAAHDN
jgi:aminoglycoside phosphotransferase (APT) family kinase protein